MTFILKSFTVRHGSGAYRLQQNSLILQNNMKTIKLLLTITLLTVSAGLGAMAPVQAADPATGPYAWPYAGRDIRTEIGKGPVVLELFSTQACVFCPTADKYFVDLLQNTDIIALSCHVDYFDVKQGSLAKSFCSDRQYRYAELLPESMVYTPQMVVNGRRDAVGYEYNDVLNALVAAGKNPPASLAVQPAGEGKYKIDLPQTKIGGGKPATVTLLTYDSPHDIKIASGANRGQTVHYPRVVSDLVKLEDWDGTKGTMTFDWVPQQTQLGFIVLAQSATGAILAVGTHEDAQPVATAPVSQTAIPGLEPAKISNEQ